METNKFEFEECDELAEFMSEQENVEKTVKPLNEKIIDHIKKIFPLFPQLVRLKKIYPTTCNYVNGYFEISFKFGDKKIYDRISGKSLKLNKQFFMDHFIFYKEKFQESVELKTGRKREEFYKFNFKAYRETLTNHIIEIFESTENPYKELRPSKLFLNEN